MSGVAPYWVVYIITWLAVRAEDLGTNAISDFRYVTYEGKEYFSFRNRLKIVHLLPRSHTLQNAVCCENEREND